MEAPQLLILAGGFGTRLRSVLTDLPKPLAPVGKEPFLFYFIKNWERQGISKFIFLLHYNSDMIISYIEKNKKSKFSENSQFEFVIEKEPLGTGGAVFNAILEKGIQNNFLLSNCDTWIGNCVENFKKQSFPAIGLIKVKKNDRYGAVNIKNNFIINFKEKNYDIEKKIINAGVYYLNPSDFVNYNNKFISLEKEFLPLLCNKKKVKAVFLKTDFIDIGVPLDYLRFVDWINNDRKGIL